MIVPILSTVVFIIAAFAVGSQHESPVMPGFATLLCLCIAVPASGVVWLAYFFWRWLS